MGRWCRRIGFRRSGELANGLIEVEGFFAAFGEICEDEVDLGVAVVAIDLGFDDEVEICADGELGFEWAHFEGDAACDPVWAGGAGDGELEVGAGGADAAWGGGEADVFDEELRAWVAAAEGFELFETFDDFGDAVGEGEFAVEKGGGGEEVGCEFFGGVDCEAVFEGLEVFEGEFDAAGHGVSAAGGEEVADVFDGVVEFESGDGAGGAVGFAGGGGEDEGWSVEEVDEAGGDDTHDASVEGVVGDDDY
jgi:hypothetical protein